MKVLTLPSVTFVAEENGIVQAALGIDWSGQYTTAGPFVVAKEAKSKRWLLLRLVETMERFLTEHGVSKYILSCACSNIRWNRILEKVGARRYATKNGRHWYIREVGAYGRVNH